MTGREHSKSIEYCTHTNNPFTGCPHGCTYCYARRMANRWAHREGTVYHRVKQALGDPFAKALFHDRVVALDHSLEKARLPRDIFVGSMSEIASDLPWHIFNDDELYKLMPASWVQMVIKHIISNHPRHTFYLLTKNPSNLDAEWPVNARIGVSATNMQEASDRLWMLLNNVSAGIRWISLEPLLESTFDPHCMEFNGLRPEWVVVGAQTGFRAPPPQTMAATNVEVWCKERDVPLFVKRNMREAWPGAPWSMEIPSGCALNPE